MNRGDPLPVQRGAVLPATSRQAQPPFGLIIYWHIIGVGDQKGSKVGRICRHPSLLKLKGLFSSKQVEREGAQGLFLDSVTSALRSLCKLGK